MRVLVWNMGVAFGASRHEAGWRHLAERSDFDVALLQETKEPPAWTHDLWPSRVWQPKYAQRRRDPWGCAVISRDLELEPYAPDDRFPWMAALPGSTAIARIAREPKWLVSVHLTARRVSSDLLARHPIEGIEVPTRDGSVWETNVIPHELHRLFGSETFLWGGDLNCDPKMDDRPTFAGGNRRVFEIYREAGSVDTRTRFHRAHQQTFFREGTDCYQLDHVFADEATERRLTDWAVDVEPVSGPEPLSDHAPILLTVDEDRPPISLGGPAQRTERQRLMTELVETTRYVDPHTGEEYDPPELPQDPTPDDEGN
jgi:endonuclease/exonuclease/phosphatase family metal-dependent hydrolase